MQWLKDRGLKGTGTVAHAPKVTALTPADEPTEVSVQDCMNSSASKIVRASPGPPYKDTPGGRRLCLAQVKRQADNTWKVATFAVRAVGSC